MHVFVTGASGHIGSAVVPELLTHGHQVVGLARSDESAAKLQQQGAEVLRADIEDLDAIAKAAAASDGVIHLAFRHELMRTGQFEAAVASDLAVINAIGDALAESGESKPFVNTGGTLMLAMGGITGRAGTEEDAFPGGPRIDAENATIALAQRGVRSSQVRLPPLVHSDLDKHGFGPTLIQIARDSGVSAYPGEGANRWPAVHTLDAARLYRLALEQAPAGSRLHAIQDTGVPLKEIATAIGRNLNLPVESAAPEHFQYLAHFIVFDNPVSNEITRELLGWEPTEAALIADYDAGHYFES